MARLRFLLAALPCLLASVDQAMAQDTGELAKESQNPIADLISVPFQNNTNFNVGTLGNDQNILNIQPVIPIKLNENWNLITRWIMPVVYQPALFPGDSSDFGLGNSIRVSFSPPRPARMSPGASARPFCCQRTQISASGPTNGAPDRQA